MVWTQTYFVDNPQDLQLLCPDRALHRVRIQPHLADVPEYIVPPALRNLAGVSRQRKDILTGNLVLLEHPRPKPDMK